MSANFVIVCGGTGKGIIRRFGDMNITAVLQIDVDDELVRNSRGGLFSVQLPVADVAETNLNSVMSLMQYKGRLEADFQRATSDGKSELAIAYERMINHVDAAVAKAVPAQLAQGMSQNPVIGRSYATRNLPTQQIKDQVANMLRMKPRDENSVVFWLVASTCGGTGNGIVHHVAKIVQEVAGDQQLTIKLVRIGSLTYSGLNELVHLSTLWAVLADYGYVEEHRRQSMRQEVASQLQIYYIDLPDVGKSKPAREEMVLSAFAAISQKELNSRFEVVFNNLAASPKVVLARIGEWNRGFDRDSVYHQTLNQLQHVLQGLLKPEFEIALRESEGLSWNILMLNDSMNKRTDTFRRIANEEMSAIRALKHRDYVQMENIEQVRANADWSTFGAFVQKFVSQSDIINDLDNINVTLRTTNGDLMVHFSRLDAARRQAQIGTAEYQKEITLAQMAVARLKHELLGNNREKGLIGGLYDAWNAVLPYKKTGNFAKDTWAEMQIKDENRKEAVSNNIGQLIQRYLQVEKSLRIINEAEKVISDARTDMHILTTTVDTEVQRLGNQYDARYTNCAALDELFGTETWLQVLRRSLSGDPDLAVREGKFRKAVEDGAKGLTEEGLRYVLNLPQVSDLNNVVNDLNTRAGANNAVWWQGMTPMSLPNLFRFSYRVFPRLPLGMMSNLEAANRKWEDEKQNTPPDYVEVSSMALGLKVYAVECTAPAQFFDNQVEQLIAQLRQYLDPKHNIYPRDFMVPDPDAWYTSYQCQRSIGVPVYVPGHWRDTQGFQDTYSYIERLTKYFNIVDQNR
ncbi:MAG: hypothetical protein ACK5GU_09575 [Chloroflexota bacterium]|jgi:hypothetical protein